MGGERESYAQLLQHLKNWSIALVVDDVEVSTATDNYPATGYTDFFILSTPIEVSAGSSISIAITLGNVRHLDDSARNGAVYYEVNFNQN